MPQVKTSVADGRWAREHDRSSQEAPKKENQLCHNYTVKHDDIWWRNTSEKIMSHIPR